MAVARAYVDKRGTRWRLRWRHQGGSGPFQAPLYFDTEDEVARAKSHIEAMGLDVPNRAVVFALVKKLPLDGLLSGPQTEEVVADDAPVITENLVDEWLEFKRLNTKYASRKKSRELLLGKRVWPVLSGRAVTAITVEHINKLLSSMQSCDCFGNTLGPGCASNNHNKGKSALDHHEAGMSQRYIDRHYVAMLGFFSWVAGVKKWRGDNPVKDTRYKQQNLASYNSQQKEDIHFYLTRSQFQILRKEFPPYYQHLLDLMVETGIRFGEATAVRGSCFIGGARPKVKIVENWTDGEDGGKILADTKGSEVRDIRIANGLLVSLASVMPKDPAKMVFTASGGGRLDHSNFLRDYWNPAVARAQRCSDHPPHPRESVIPAAELAGRRCGDNGGLDRRGLPCRGWVVPGVNRCKYHLGPDPDAVSTCECWDKRLPRALTPHDLRHTAAAWWLSSGVPLIVVSRRLGHKSVQTTETIYAGLLNDVVDQLVELTTLYPESTSES